MNFKNMNYYLTVCASDTITSAAEILSVSQQALSQTMKKIEQEFNVKLFERTNPIILTNEGIEVKKTFENIINEYASLSNAFRSKDTLTIGYYASPSDELKQLFEMLQEKCTGLKLVFKQLIGLYIPSSIDMVLSASQMVDHLKKIVNLPDSLHIWIKEDDEDNTKIKQFMKKMNQEKEGNRYMSKIAVMTDTGSGLSVAEGKELGIYVTPLQIIDGEKEYHDLIDITTKQVYDLIREGNDLKTSSPTYGYIDQTIKEIKKAGYDSIIYVPLTTGLSSTATTTFTIAAENDIDIYLIDTYTTVWMQKYATFKVKELVDANKSVDEILAIFKEHLEHSDTMIVVPDLTTLKKGGRVTPAAAALAGMLKIVPILQLNVKSRGVIDTFKKVRTEKKAISTAIDSLLESVIDMNNAVIGIVHSEMDSTALEAKQVFIERGIHEKNIHIVDMNSVISVHTGLNVIGFQYFDDIHA